MQQFIRRRQARDTNIEPYWDVIKRIIHESDIVLEVLDARLVELSRNEDLERFISEAGRAFIFVVNKSDLVDKDKIHEQVELLKAIAPVVFVSEKNKKSYKILLSEIKNLFSKCGKREIIERKVGDPKLKFRECKADIVVGVLGYPNVGKSSIINGLTHKKKAKVSKKAGTTHGIHWINLGDDIKLIDSPGVIPLKKEDEIRYGLIGAMGEERLRHPDIVAHSIIKLFLKNNKRKFERFYDISVDEEIKNNDSYGIIEKIARKRSFLLKGGIPDENRANSLIIRDWQNGGLRL